MSTVDYDPQLPGDPRDPTAYNTAIAAVETESASLDPENWATEGLELRHLAAGVRPATPQFYVAESTRGVVSDVAGVWQTTAFTFSGTAFEYLTNFALQGQDLLVMRYRIHFSTALGAPPDYGIPDAGEFRARISTKLVSGAHVVNAESVGRIATPNLGTGIGAHGTCQGTGWLVAADTVDEIRLDWWTNGGGANSYHPHTAVFAGWIYHDIGVL